MGVPRKKLRSRILFIADVLLLLLVQILQGSALNYFFIKQYEEYFTSYFLFILDFFCLCIFTGTFVLSYNHFNQKNHEERGKSFLSAVNKRWPDLKLGILPMCYVSWFLYSSILITKLTVIFLRLNSYEHNHTQVLQVCLGLSSIVFMFLVEGHNWHKKTSEGYSFMNDMCKKIGIEIFDSVEMFDLLITQDRMSRTMENVIFSLSSANYVLPTLSLYELCQSDFGKKNTRTCRTVRIIHNLLRLSLIDIPFFIVRILSWVNHKDMTIFMVKNLFHIIMAVHELYLDIFMYFRPLPKSKKTSTTEEIPLENEQNQTDGLKSDTNF